MLQSTDVRASEGRVVRAEQMTDLEQCAREAGMRYELWWHSGPWHSQEYLDSPFPIASIDSLIVLSQSVPTDTLSIQPILNYSKIAPISPE